MSVSLSGSPFKGRGNEKPLPVLTVDYNSYRINIEIDMSREKSVLGFGEDLLQCDKIGRKR
jgi:hypothetical protein